MNVRPAKTSDAKAVSDIWNSEIRDGVSTFTAEEKSVQTVADLIGKRNSAFLVLEQSEAVTGFATFGEFRGGKGYAHSAEHTVYLASNMRGRGGGQALMTALETQARAAGIHVLVAAIGGENHAAIAFHLAMGFRETGRMPEVGRKFDRWMDLVLMQKIL